MSAFQKYMEAREHVARMRAEHNAASRGLDLALVRERAAELASQADPLNAEIDSILGRFPDGVGRGVVRDLCARVARYVAFGRGLDEPDVEG